MTKATCFFCYAWGSEERYDVLDYLRKRIEEKSDDMVSVILDRHAYQDNEDFNVLRERIRRYDLVMVFLTPDFKAILDDPASNSNKGREVLKEYRIVEERYGEDEDSIFPVILEGTKETALPDLFENKIARAFPTFGLYRNGKGRLVVPRQSRAAFSHFVENVIRAAHLSASNRSNEYGSANDALNGLFGLTDIRDIPSRCLVVPEVYQQVRRQSRYLIVGRKGSGKSTFIYNFREMDKAYFDDHYKRMVPLSAEAFNHENAYESLIARHWNDRGVVDAHAVLCLFWETYFVLHCVIVIKGEIEVHNIKRDDRRYRKFNRMANHLLRIMGLASDKNHYKKTTDPRVAGSVFNAAVEMVNRRFDTALDEVKEGELLVTSFASKFNLEGLLFESFGTGEVLDFAEALEQCERRIMVSLDGFDTHSEDFRMSTDGYPEESDERRERSEYERLFFRTLVEVVSNFKNHTADCELANDFGRYMHFCVVMPKDTYDVIRANDRDIAKRRFGTLSWSAYELLELLTKRLEYLIGKVDASYVADESKDFFARWDDALGYFKNLPKTISMQVGGNTVKMELFNYILRMSFWRPRDVISNLSTILSYVVRVRNAKLDLELMPDGSMYRMEDEIVKKRLRDKADDIIADEFIGEYKYSFMNLGSVLQSMHRWDEQMPVLRFEERISQVPFHTTFSYDMTRVENKMMVLYQLGVIGLHFDRSYARAHHYLSHICFEFNEGMSPFRDYGKMDRQDKERVDVVFNPIFVRNLELTCNTRELTGDWSRDYIRKNHANKDSIHNV